jgi:diacylglycerol kinase (ATP)
MKYHVRLRDNQSFRKLPPESMNRLSTGMNGAKVPSILCTMDVRVFVNPIAGGGRGRGLVAKVQKLFEASGVQARFVTTRSAAELKSFAQEAIADGCEALFAMGGDGTFQALANAAFGSQVLLGVIPIGGGNDFAAALGLPGNPLQAVNFILQAQACFVDLVRVRTVQGPTCLYAGGGGIGLDAEAARYASGALRWLPGRLRYIAAVLLALAGFKPQEVRVDFPGSDLPPIEVRSLLAAVLNSPTYGAGLRLAPEAAVNDGLLHVVVIEDLKLLEVLALLPRLLLTGELRTSRAQRRSSPKVRLTTAQPCLFHGDGEILGETPIEIEVVPRAARVLGAGMCKNRLRFPPPFRGQSGAGEP